MLLNQMASGLCLPERVIQALAHKASHAYKSYRIPKRTGGTREIHHPSKELKALQRWLVHNVIERWPVHPAAMAYRPQVSILNNAERHVGSRFLLRMDFEGFFPSITADDVRNFLKNSNSLQQTGWSTDDVELFTALVCRIGKLTIGAPTSPALSNALCFELDQRLETLAHERNAAYTRYADDLFFSTNQANVLKDFPNLVTTIVTDLSCPSRLIINKLKTRHSSKRGCRRVTGLVLGSDNAVGIGRYRKRYIRGLIHRFPSLTPAQKVSLAGLVAFATGVEPDFVNALILKFGVQRVTEVQRAIEANKA